MKNNKLHGASNKLTSTANQDIAVYKRTGMTNPEIFKKFEFFNYKDCHVKVNGGESVFLPANFGIELNFDVTSFVIVETGIEFIWVGEY